VAIHKIILLYPQGTFAGVDTTPLARDVMGRGDGSENGGFGETGGDGVGPGVKVGFGVGDGLAVGFCGFPQSSPKSRHPIIGIGAKR
jgi:hypothetical protein